MSRFSLKNKIMASALVLLGSGAGAMADDDARLEHMKIIGFADDAVFQQSLQEVVPVLAKMGMLCGSAMTDEACVAVKKNMNDFVIRDSNAIRDNVMDRIEAQAEASGGMDAWIEAERAGLAGTLGVQPCKDGKADRSCQLLMDGLFTGALVPTLEDARRQANRDVPQFYKNGQPFDE